MTKANHFKRRKMAFALTPGQNVDAVLDFGDKSHRAIYEKSIAPLPIDSFDCVNTQLVDFMSALSKKAHDFGWTDRILKIPLTLPEAADTEYINMLTNHAQVTIETIREYELSYVATQTRERQDMHCLYSCLMDSLSQEGRSKVLTEKEKYTIPSDPADEDSEPALSGNLLLKVILMKSTVDNRSGAYSIRMKLSELDVLIAKLGHNIEKFNHQVKNFIEDLSRRGETSDDVIYNLIKAYRVVPVKEFTSFVDRLKDDFDNMEEGDQQHTPQYLMDKAENKYKILVNEGTWDNTMNDKDELMALRAELNKLKKNSKKQADGKPKAKNQKKSGKKRVDITRKPRGDLHKPVVIDGKEWYWCSKETGGKCNPGALRRHKPSECKGTAGDSGSTDSKKRSKSGNEAKKRLKLKASETVINGEGDDTESEISREDFQEEDDN